MGYVKRKIFPNLMAEMTRTGISQEVLAEKIKISRVSLSYKMNGRSEFTLREMLAICEAIRYDEERLGYLFKKNENEGG